MQMHFKLAVSFSVRMGAFADQAKRSVTEFLDIGEF